MKNKKNIFFILLIVVASCLFVIYEAKNRLVYDYEEDEEFIGELISEYEENTKNLKTTTVEEIYENLNIEEKCLIYVGRVTCEWCRLFVGYLSDYTTKNDIDVFYLDSTDTDTNKKLKEFRDQNGIEYVPALMYYTKENGLEKIEFDITDPEFSSEKLDRIITDIVE